MSKLMSLLFETNAFNVAPENSPFWYTSGKIGPYFINADYLYGSSEDSKSLLSFIDNELASEDKKDLPNHVFKEVLSHYNSNEIYKLVIDSMVNYIKENIDLNSVDYISGGERRDWYFSNLISYLLNKPHITIYKDLTTIVSNSDFSESDYISKLENKNLLHIADLLNQSVSFTRNWIPAVNTLGSSIKYALFAIDRMDGGTAVLEDCNVEVHSLLKINDELLVQALDLGFITKEQLEVVRKFKKDPMDSMKQFLINHPEFIENAKKYDNKKTQDRVKILVEQDIYGLNSNK